MKQCLFRIYVRVAGVVAVAAAATCALASAPASASAALITNEACSSASFSEPFAAWGDDSQYELVPGGSFEAGAPGWSLSHGASVVSASSEPYGVTGSVGTHSLYLPAGASAESPAVCVDAAYPMFRLFGRDTGLLSTVLVQVVYQYPILGRISVPVGVIALSSSWQPSLPMLTASAVEGVLHEGVADVSLRFTALLGSSSIEDVYVDPRLAH